MPWTRPFPYQICNNILYLNDFAITILSMSDCSGCLRGGNSEKACGVRQKRMPWPPPGRTKRGKMDWLVPLCFQKKRGNKCKRRTQEKAPGGCLVSIDMHCDGCAGKLAPEATSCGTDRREYYGFSGVRGQGVDLSRTKWEESMTFFYPVHQPVAMWQIVAPPIEMRIAFDSWFPYSYRQNLFP